jgi:hypothetical protein
MRSFLVALAIAVLFSVSLAAHAAPVTYTETVTADGSLGINDFSDQLVTISGTGDTSNVALYGPGVYFLDLSNATVKIGTGAAVNLTDTLIAFANQGSVAGSLSEAIGDVLDTTGSAFATYNLETAITVTGSPLINPGLAFGTSAGDFDMLTTDSNSTFTATLGSSAAPEPSSLILFATGLLGVAETARRKWRLLN